LAENANVARRATVLFLVTSKASRKNTTNARLARTRSIAFAAIYRSIPSAPPNVINHSHRGLVMPYVGSPALNEIPSPRNTFFANCM
jgi:hypothetical protein